MAVKLVKESVFEGVSILTVGQHPLRQPRLVVNLFAIDGLLIDTGPSRMQQEVLSYVNSRHVNQIFVTHHHEDHTGNVALLAQTLDCPVYSSPRCAEMMKAPPRISFAQYMVWGNRPPYTGLEPIESTIRTDRYQFQLIPAPGHTPDQVVLYEPHQKWLFSADLYVHHYISYFLFSESVAQQITSIEKVLTLDFETLFCCHIPPIKDGREKLEKKLRFLQQFNDRVREEASKGYSARKIMKTLQLKEKWPIRILSHGMLSQLNMVQSVLNDIESERQPPIR